VSPTWGNWVSGWLDPRKVNYPDNTNTVFLLDPRYGALGPYTKSVNVYRCLASKITCQEGGSSYPLVRNVAMSVWMGCRTVPWGDSNDSYRTFRKQSGIVGISVSDALVFVDERDDSIDDGVFEFEMAQNRMRNFPAGYHAGSGGVTFADGHAEIHRWRSAEVLAPQQFGVQTVKYAYLMVAANNPDLLWFRKHLTAPGP
jgi:prepilin-type processing-associated H-X9-DG protein